MLIYSTPLIRQCGIKRPAPRLSGTFLENPARLANLTAPVKLLRFLVLLLVFSSLPQLVRAHQVETVEFEFQKLDKEWRLLGDMDIAFMLPETRKVQGGQPLSREAVMKAPPEELARIRRETENTLRHLMRMTFAGKDIPWRIEFPDFEKKPFALPEELADWALLSVRIVVDAQPGPGEFRIHWNDEESAELIVLTEDSEDGEIVSVRPGGEIVLVKVAATGVATATTPKSTFGGWIYTGYRHVLPVGLDHMLFIFGLFLIVLKWRPLMWQSLVFTVAHSATLALSVLGWVHLDTKIVDILIAFSIAFIGVENLLAHKVGKLRYILVFCFGLIHGIGFASTMADKVKGIPRDQLTAPLLGFNVGVELAQITVLAASFLIFWPIQKHTRLAQTVGSVIVALAGAGWMIQRMFFV
jgi:hypothetical protein